eukprot:gene12988-biopygen3946
MAADAASGAAGVPAIPAAQMAHAAKMKVAEQKKQQQTEGRALWLYQLGVGGSSVLLGHARTRDGETRRIAKDRVA